MPPPTSTIPLRPRRRAKLVILTAGALALAACSGGGGPSGNGGDNIPPPAPNLSLITASVPLGGTSSVTGGVGAVESRATVQITNVSATQRAGGTPVTARTQAIDTGAFLVGIPAVIGDILEIVAIDAADNTSPKVELTAGPSLSSIQLRLTAGNQQVGVTGRALTDSFRVQATVAQSQSVIPGLVVLFESETPGGSFSPNRVATNSSGTAATVYTLGPTQGVYNVIAKLEIAPSNQVQGTAQAVGAPQISSITPASMTPGDTVTITGSNFSPISAHNVVQFGSERAAVVSATLTSLRVVVPPFATQGQITVTLTGVTSNVLNVTVNPAVVVGRTLGQVSLETLPPSADGQVILPFESAAQEFTLVIQSLQATPNLNGVRVTGTAGAVIRAGRALDPAAAPEALVAGESFIRAMERQLIQELPRQPIVPSRALTPAQDIGSTRQFFVVNKPTAILLTDPANFDQITATLLYEGDHTLLYLDNRALHTLTAAQIQQIGDRYDDLSYPTDVAAFGEPSDIDANGKVIIILSPTVNALTTPPIMAQGARIVGFFFGVDLLPNPVNNPHANGGEVFYSVVPNETNEFTGARVTQAEVVNLLGSVFAHEFEHMISFNIHVLNGTGGPEALWLDEGLAHMAESLNGFHDQNRLRSAFFIDSPQDVTMVSGGDGLDERGAAWLFVQYLVDRFGQDILRRLVPPNLTSTGNVSAAAGRPFATLFHEWAATLMLDGDGIPNDAIYELTSVDLRGDFELSKQQLGDRVSPVYLALRSLFAPGNALDFQQRGTSPLYVTVTSRGRANVPITIDGQPNSLLQISVIRTR